MKAKKADKISAESKRRNFALTKFFSAREADKKNVEGMSANCTTHFCADLDRKGCSPMDTKPQQYPADVVLLDGVC